MTDPLIEPAIVSTDGLPVKFVTAYEYGRAYGGPEEGGWWYDVGEPITSICCLTEQDVEDAFAKLRRVYPSTGNASSVLGGEDHIVLIDDHPGRPFPEYRPHYE